MVTNRYTRVAIALHWLIALGIVGNVVLVWVIDALPASMARPAIDTHKSLGLTVLALALMRVLWRLTHRPPPFPRSCRPLERVAAHAVHAGLYLLILAMPISGYLHDSAFRLAASHPLTWFGLFQVPRVPAIMHLPAAEKAQVHAFWFSVHATLAWVLYGLFALHVAGALKHQFVDREPELQRMLP